MYRVYSRRRDAPDSAAGPQADFPFEGEAGVRPDGVMASQEPCSGKFRRGGRGDLRLTVVPPVDMGIRRMVGLLVQNAQSIRIWRRRVPEHQEIRDIVFESQALRSSQVLRNPDRFLPVHFMDMFVLSIWELPEAGHRGSRVL